MATTYPVKTEAWHAGGFMISEAAGHRARDRATLTGAAVILPGTVLGKKTAASAAVAAALGTNVGTSTFSAFTLTTGILPGAYTLRMQDATKFVVEDPAGVEVGHGALGAAFSAGGLAFTLTTGGVPTAGDSYTITVTPSAFTMAPIDFAATTGLQNAAGIAWDYTDVTSADKPGTVVTRACEVNASELVWPSGATTAQKNAALLQLEALGIINR